MIKTKSLPDRLRDSEMYIDACDEAARELERLYKIEQAALAVVEEDKFFPCLFSSMLDLIKALEGEK